MTLFRWHSQPPEALVLAQVRLYLNLSMASNNPYAGAAIGSDVINSIF